MNCNEGPRSRFPSRIFFDAALRNLDLWVRHGIAPPHADPILVDERRRRCSTSSATCRAACARPTWTCRRARGTAARPARRSASSPATRCRSTRRGSPSCIRTHGAYVRKVVRSTADLVGDRLLTLPDGLRIIEEAARADVP